MDISREPSERDLPLLGERSQVASAPSTPRVALLDNAKGALIYCVVLYHVAVVYTGADRPETPVRYASGFLMVLKPVMMPGFCLISGHLSRASLTPRSRIGRLVTDPVRCVPAPPIARQAHSRRARDNLALPLLTS